MATTKMFSTQGYNAVTQRILDGPIHAPYHKQNGLPNTKKGTAPFIFSLYLGGDRTIFHTSERTARRPRKALS